MSTQTVTIAEPVAAITAAESVVTVELVQPVVAVTIDEDDIAVSVEQVAASVATSVETVSVSVVSPQVVVAETVSGPQGPSGTEDAVPYAERVDFVGDTVIYRGYAELVDGEPGPAEADAVWRIKRLTFVGPDVSTTWADGNANFDNAWNDRAALTYS